MQSIASRRMLQRSRAVGCGRLSRGSPARGLSFGLILRRLAPTLLRLRVAEMLLVLLRRLLIGRARFAERDRDRLSAIFHLLTARPRTKLAMLEFMHDALDGLL